MENHILFDQNGQPLFTSAQACALTGINRQYLQTILSRHPHLRPARKIGQDFFWVEGEIAALAAKKSSTKMGRPAKG